MLSRVVQMFVTLSVRLSRGYRLTRTTSYVNCLTPNSNTGIGSRTHLGLVALGRTHAIGAIVFITFSESDDLCKQPSTIRCLPTKVAVTLSSRRHYPMTSGTRF